MLTAKKWKNDLGFVFPPLSFQTCFGMTEGRIQDVIEQVFYIRIDEILLTCKEVSTQNHQYHVTNSDCRRST